MDIVPIYFVVTTYHAFWCRLSEPDSTLVILGVPLPQHRPLALGQGRATQRPDLTDFAAQGAVSSN